MFLFNSHIFQDVAAATELSPNTSNNHRRGKNTSITIFRVDTQSLRIHLEVF